MAESLSGHWRQCRANEASWLCIFLLESITACKHTSTALLFSFKKATCWRAIWSGWKNITVTTISTVHIERTGWAGISWWQWHICQVNGKNQRHGQTQAAAERAARMVLKMSDRSDLFFLYRVCRRHLQAIENLYCNATFWLIISSASAVKRWLCLNEATVLEWKKNNKTFCNVCIISEGKHK